jgi:lipoprotein NlpI
MQIHLFEYRLPAHKPNARFLLTIGTVSAAVLLGITTVAAGTDYAEQLTNAQKELSKGNLDGAIEHLESLLKASDLNQELKERARGLAARALQARGEESFRQARIQQALADFDRRIQLQPNEEAGNWQRGIAYYYAGEYEKGARQFALHKTVNPQDVENAAWHFLCLTRAPKGSIETARKSLIDVTSDSRVPMAQIQKMFAGTMPPEKVLAAGIEAGGTEKFYADLYVGLYYEALHQDAESLRLLKLAADNPSAKENYMGDVARVHVKLRTKKPL